MNAERRRHLIIFCALALFFCMDAVVFRNPALGGEIPRLLLGIPLYANDARMDMDFIGRLRPHLRETDILVLHGKTAEVRLLKAAGRGQTCVIRQALADLRKDIAFLESHGVRVDVICYNPEHWKSSHTPQSEKDDIVKSCAEARRLADKRGAKLMLILDSGNLLPEYGAAVAPLADIMGVQLQRWQSLSAEEFRKQARALIEPLRRANPKLTVIAQFSTNPPSGERAPDGSKEYVPMSADDMISRIHAIRPEIDGAAFLIFHEKDGFGRLLSVVKALRIL